MKILVVNPNSTESMTNKIGECARRVAGTGTKIIVTCPSDTPASIEGHFDAAVSIPSVIKLIRDGENNDCDGYVVACFDDPGIEVYRELVQGPVIGVCEAAMRATAIIANSFSVVTTLPRSVPIIEDMVVKYGMERYCRRVRAANIPVLSLEEKGSEAHKSILNEINRAVIEDHCEAVILGCAGMSDLTVRLSAESGVPVIDGVGVAVKMIEALIGAGLKTSKIGAYAQPIFK